MSADVRSRANSATPAQAAVAAVTLLAACMANAKEDIEFVQEHLPEVAMDNRYATLPIWSGGREAGTWSGAEFQAGFNSTTAGGLTIDGPLLSVGAYRRLNEHWSAGAFAFYDRLRLEGDREQRDLQTLFAPDTPITRPVAAEFSGLDGRATDFGVGIGAGWRSDRGALGEHRWVGGLLWQRMKLADYRFDYRMAAGPQSGLTGTIDFDAQYTHIVPFIGLELPRGHGRWTTNAHALVAYPLPRRGVIGHITGPEFDFRGDTAKMGNGKHFGDPSVTLGYTITYEPARVSVDFGALLTQELLEPRVHRGIERNILLSIYVGW